MDRITKIVFFSLLGVWLFSRTICPVQKYTVRSQEGVTLILTEPVWLYWIHRYTADAKPYEENYAEESSPGFGSSD